MKNRATFLKKRALLALYLAAPLYLCIGIINELPPSDTLWDISDALSWFFAPSILLTLVIGGNVHDLNAPLLYAFSFTQTYLTAFIIVMLAGTIRRAASRRAAKPAG
jgi:hypothetical protein